MQLSPTFQDQISRTWGERGEQWLRHLPDLLAALEREWELQILSPFENLTYHYVGVVNMKKGGTAVLKVGVPDSEQISEIHALRCYEGRGSVSILKADEGLGALLLEHLRPGKSLWRYEDDDRATTILAETMQALWRPSPAGEDFRDLRSWTRALPELTVRSKEHAIPLSEPILDKATRVLEDLLNSTQPSVLLHGDLHHDNVLAAQRAPWLAIDPKGLSGDPSFDVGTLLHNSYPATSTAADLKAMIQRRIAILSEVLGFDRNRIAAWGFVQAVLGACWEFQDGGNGWRGSIEFAQYFTELAHT